MVSLDPDRWGRSWRSELHLVFHGALVPKDTQHLLDPGVITEPCCAVINKMLDAITYVGGPAYLSLVTPDDIWAIEVDYLYEGQRVSYIQARGLHTPLVAWSTPFRQYRLSPEANAHRSAPGGWAKVLACLARNRIRELTELANELDEQP